VPTDFAGSYLDHTDLVRCCCRLKPICIDDNPVKKVKKIHIDGPEQTEEYTLGQFSVEAGPLREQWDQGLCSDVKH
jgi:hypothetical protein